MNIWISCDLHLYCVEPDERHPFRTRRNLGLLSDNFASDISQEDVWIFLGDLCDPEAADKDQMRKVIQSIPCRKYMCRGNHDTEDDIYYLELGFTDIGDIIRYHNIIFSHKPCYVAPDEVNVHGHLHTQILSNMGPNHINAYASNWNDGEHPVLLEDLIDSAIVQDLEVTQAENSKIQTQYELYTSLFGDTYAKFLDITDAIDGLDTPQVVTESASDDVFTGILEFNKIMHTYNYGLRINGVWDPKRNTTAADWDKYLKVQSPKEFAQSRVGVCWDYVTYEAQYFKDHFPRVKYKCWYIVINDDDDMPTHTFLTFAWKGNYYLFESSFQKIQGVWAAKKEKDLVDFILDSMNQYDRNHRGKALDYTRYVCTYNALDPAIPGMGCMEYMTYMADHGADYDHKFNPKYQVVQVAQNKSINEVADKEQSLDNPVLLYHGSNSKFKVLKAFPSPAYPDKPRVFATPSYKFALAFAGKQWSDLEINQCTVDGEQVLTEILPGMFEEKFKCPGFIHVLEPDGFEKFGRSMEWVCPHDVSVSKVDRINNVLAEMKRQKIRLYMYPDLPPHIQSREQYIRNIIDKYQMDTTYEMLRDRYSLTESVKATADTDMLSEILFQDSEDTKYWMADSEDYPKKVEKAKEQKGNTAVTIDEAFGKKTLYHGSPYKVDSLEPTALDLGNAFEKPGWSIFFFDDPKLAEKWSIFMTLRMLRKLDPTFPRIHIYSFKTSAYSMVLTAMQEDLDAYCKYLDKHPTKSYVYTCTIPVTDIGIGNDSTHNEFTVRKSVKPDKVREVNITSDLLRAIVEVKSWDDIVAVRKANKANMRGPLSIFMTYDYYWNKAHNKDDIDRIGMAAYTGELKPGDDVEAYIQKHHLKIERVPLKERMKPFKPFYESTATILDAQDVIDEALIGSEPDIEMNLKDWRPNGKNFLYICGLSASGKTTQANAMAKQYGVEVIHLDDLAQAAFVGKMANPNYRDRMSPTMQEYWDSTTDHITMYRWGDQRIGLETDKFIKWMIANHASDGKRYIIEGCEIWYIDPDYLIHQPLIIKGTSAMKTVAWRFKRTYGQHLDKGENPLQAFTHCLKQLATILKNGSMIAAENTIQSFKNVLKAAQAYEEQMKTTNEAARQKVRKCELVFLSTDSDWDESVIEPRIPNNYMTQNGFEDAKTPRVCFSTSISRALRAMSQNCTGMEFYVYVPGSDDYKVITPTKKQVPDVDLTNERWILEPVVLYRAGKIKVLKSSKNGLSYLYGDNQKAELFDWTWKWIERDGEDPANGEVFIVNETATKECPIITAKTKKSSNPNDGVSSAAVRITFYNHRKEEIGMAAASAIDTDTAFLYDVEVYPAYRGKGYGNSIMQYMMDNYPITELTVEKSNKIAISLYKKFGFKKAMDFKENGKDMIDMKTAAALTESADDTVDHTLTKKDKTNLAKKYGLTDVGNDREYDDEKELAEMKRKEADRKAKKALDNKKKARDKQLKNARSAKKRKAFFNKVKSSLPGVKKEEASAVDNDDIDWTDGGEYFFRSHTDQKKFIQESYSFQLVDKVQFMDRLDEAAQKNPKYQPVYIIIMHTGTMLANTIKTAIGSMYSHASISFDSSLRNMYSFARKLADDGKSSHDGGFRKEDITNPFFKDKEIKFSMYMVPCTADQIKLMQKRLDYFQKNQSKFTYDFTGLVKNFFHISDNPEYRWFCTRFVADILNSGRPNDPYIKDPFLVRPDDFMKTNFAMFVTSGYLDKYNQKEVDRTTKRLLNQKKVQQFMEDTQNEMALDLPYGNPYERHILNFQLSKMDEAAVDNFLMYLKSFKVRFDANGDIRITRREFDQLDAHFRASLKLIKACEEAGNVEGVKEELYKIHYMIELINQYYLKPYAKNYRPNTKEVRKDMMDLRSVMMNAFKQHLEWVTLREPRYNFQRGYQVSTYGTETKIPHKVITHVGKTITTMLV